MMETIKKSKLNNTKQHWGVVIAVTGLLVVAGVTGLIVHAVDTRGNPSDQLKRSSSFRAKARAKELQASAVNSGSVPTSTLHNTKGEVKTSEVKTLRTKSAITVSDPDPGWWQDVTINNLTSFPCYLSGVGLGNPGDVDVDSPITILAGGNFNITITPDPNDATTQNDWVVSFPNIDPNANINDSTTFTPLSGSISFKNDVCGNDPTAICNPVATDRGWMNETQAQYQPVLAPIYLHVVGQDYNQVVTSETFQTTNDSRAEFQQPQNGGYAIIEWVAGTPPSH